MWTIVNKQKYLALKRQNLVLRAKLGEQIDYSMLSFDDLRELFVYFKSVGKLEEARYINDLIKGVCGSIGKRIVECNYSKRFPGHRNPLPTPPKSITIICSK